MVNYFGVFSNTPLHSSAAYMKPFNAQISRQVGSSRIYIALNTYISIAAIAICSHYLTNQPKATRQSVQQTTTLNATPNIQYEKQNIKKKTNKRQQIPKTHPPSSISLLSRQSPHPVTSQALPTRPLITHNNVVLLPCASLSFSFAKIKNKQRKSSSRYISWMKQSLRLGTVDGTILTHGSHMLKSNRKFFTTKCTIQ